VEITTRTAADVRFKLWLDAKASSLDSKQHVHFSWNAQSYRVHVLWSLWHSVRQAKPRAFQVENFLLCFRRLLWVKGDQNPRALQPESPLLFVCRDAVGQRQSFFN